MCASRRPRLARAAVLAMLITGAAFAAAPGSEGDARSDAKSGAQVRRVWVLSEPAGYGSGNRNREIVVYELVCEQGKMTKISDGFEVASGPKFGEGWVLRTQTAMTEDGAQEQLQQALADICGI